MEKLKDQLVLHEGIRLKPYKCPAGKLTIGIGRNIEDNGISKDEAFYMLDNDIKECVADLLKIFPAFESYSTGRQYGLIDLRFNIGPTRFRQFRKMIAAIGACDWDKASDELVDSRWWGQVQATRRNTIFRQLLTGEI